MCCLFAGHTILAQSTMQQELVRLSLKLQHKLNFTYIPGRIGEVEASTRMDGPVVVVVAADRTAASATAAALLGRTLLEPADLRVLEAEHSLSVIFALWAIYLTR